MGSTTRRTAVGIGVLGLIAALASPAESGPTRTRADMAARPARVHIALSVRHCGLNGCTESNELTMAGNGGLGISMTDDIPANATEASVSMSPICHAARDLRRARVASCGTPFTDMIDSFVGDLPQLARLTAGKPATRLIGCAYVASTAKVVATLIAGRATELQAASFTATVFLTCLQILAEEAGSTTIANADPARNATIASQRCARVVQTLRVKFSKAGRKVVAQGVSSPKTSKARLPVSIACKHSGAGLLITLKPTRRGMKLPQVIGPTVGIGYVNTGHSPASVKTTFKVN